MSAAMLALVLTVPAFAQAPVEPADSTTVPASRPIRDAEPVVVSGALPGPGMWKVRKGEHTMYVLGTMSPVPEGMQWTSREVRAVLEEADEVILGYGAKVDAEIGFFSRLTMIPSLLGARKNPDDRPLRDFVSPDDYARWTVLKQRYIGRDGSVEKWRPIFAAGELYGEAIKERGLSMDSVTWPVIEEMIERRDIRKTEPRLAIKVSDPKGALKQFRAEQLGDGECFSATLRNLEADLDRMTDRANAWAVGDIEALRAIPRGNQYEVCMKALAGAGVMRKYGPPDLDGAVRAVWLEAAEKALAGNRVTFATLPMVELLKPDNFLDSLQARGYEVETP
jgi:hypothetical protein